MSDAIVKRLEAVAAKLEQFVHGAPAASSAPAAPSAGPSARLQAFDALVQAAMQPFVDAANAVPGTKAVVSRELDPTHTLGVASARSKEISESRLTQARAIDTNDTRNDSDVLA